MPIAGERHLTSQGELSTLLTADLECWKVRVGTWARCAVARPIENVTKFP